MQARALLRLFDERLRNLEKNLSKMSGTKGLNTTDSVNRVRFANLSQRLSRVNVDVVHRTRAQGSLDLHHSAVPTTGPLGCHFQDELELCKTLDTASHFKR